MDSRYSITIRKAEAPGEPWGAWRWEVRITSDRYPVMVGYAPSGPEAAFAAAMTWCREQVAVAAA